MIFSDDQKLIWLSFAGMKFSAAGELTIGPFAVLGGAGCRRSGKRCFRAPVRGRGMNSPDVAGFIERDPDHPPLTSATQRHTVGHAGGHAFLSGQFFQGDCQSRLQRVKAALHNLAY